MTEKILSRLLTITHGDFWSNNMMFSHDGATGLPTSIKLIDFQMMGRGHPAADICYFLHINTDRDFRREHLQGLLRDYFDVFSGYLGSDMEDFSFDQFEEEFQERRDIGLILGLLVRKLMLAFFFSF